MPHVPRMGIRYAGGWAVLLFIPSWSSVSRSGRMVAIASAISGGALRRDIPGSSLTREIGCAALILIIGDSIGRWHSWVRLLMPAILVNHASNKRDWTLDTALFTWMANLPSSVRDGSDRNQPQWIAVFSYLIIERAG